MKITLNIEVANADELNQIADALKTVKSAPTVAKAEVAHDIDVEVAVPDEEVEEVKEVKPKKAKTSKSKKEKVEEVKEEEYEEVPSPFTEPAGPLVSEDEVKIPPVIETPKVEPTPAPQAQNVANNAQVVEYIKTQAKRLADATTLPPEAKRNVINSLLVEIQAPQGLKASELPEPYLSLFANRIAGKIDAALGAPNAALV